VPTFVFGFEARDVEQIVKRRASMAQRQRAKSQASAAT
jgi:hypothetical protein